MAWALDQALIIRFPHCHPFEERNGRQKVANDANFPLAARGFKEGSLANLCDAMRLLESIWSEVEEPTIARGWQRTKLRRKLSQKDDRSNNDETNEVDQQPKKKKKRQLSKIASGTFVLGLSIVMFDL